MQIFFWAKCQALMLCWIYFSISWDPEINSGWQWWMNKAPTLRQERKEHRDTRGPDKLMRSSWLQLARRTLVRSSCLYNKKAPRTKCSTWNLVELRRLEERKIFSEDFSDDRRRFVSLEASDSVGEKRYKSSDRSELVFEKKHLRARGGKKILRWRIF